MPEIVTLRRQSVPKSEEHKKKISEGRNKNKRVFVPSPQIFKYGERREDGHIFSGYATPRSPYETNETWMTPEAWFRARIGAIYRGAQKRAKEDSIPFDLGYDFLISIFPMNMICPVLGIEMSWGEPRETSPSLDRIDPDRKIGYVKRNVQWMSFKANRIKSNASAEEISKVADFLKKVGQI